VRNTNFDPVREFDRQEQTLVDLGVPARSGRTDDEFRALAAPLREQAVATQSGAPREGRAPFVLVVKREMAPIEDTMPLTTLAGKAKPGFVDRRYPSGDLEKFTPIAGLDLPDAQLYLLHDVDRGEEFCGAVPEQAMSAIAERGRTLLTIEEGIAFLLHQPGSLAKNKCYSLGGSRCGDRRVPALWISQGAPKLGWCWAGNPHTWLGMASAGGRLGPNLAL
jgi:hypothetical protein